MRVVVVALLAVLAAGCSTVPVTVAPYASYSGTEGGRNDYPNQWQVGVGLSFTLGGQGGYVTPVPSHPTMPSRVVVNNTQTNSTTQSNTNTQTQTQNQNQDQTHNGNNGNNGNNDGPPFGNGGGNGPK